MNPEIEHLHSLFENATEGFVVTDTGGLIFMVNPAACRMFGYTSADLAGQPIEILIPQPIREKHITLRNDFYHSPSNRVMGHGRDLHAQRRDGSIFPVEVSLSTYVHDGRRYVIGFIIDITERKIIEENILRQQSELEKLTSDMRALNLQLEKKVQERTSVLEEALEKLGQSQQELESALDKERQLNEIKSRFVSMASHEFRTPLSTMLSSATLAKKYSKEEDQPKRERHLDKINLSVKHLNDLLEDFLSLGRLDENRISIKVESFDIKALVIETIEELKGVIHPSQAIEPAHSGTSLFSTDARLVKNILINLLSNACKFSPHLKPVLVSTEVKGSILYIAVTDRGIGIPVDDQQYLFTSFFRAGNAGNIQGTGLGLHIVKRYVDLLKGTITFNSSPETGTTFSLELPEHFSNANAS